MMNNSFKMILNIKDNYLSSHIDAKIKHEIKENF